MKNIAAYVDHTFLKAAGDEDAVKKLCREAKKFGFASVCVNPAEVALAAKLLKKSDEHRTAALAFAARQLK